MECGQTAKLGYAWMAVSDVVEKSKSSAEFRESFLRCSSVRRGKKDKSWRQQSVESEKQISMETSKEFWLLTVDEVKSLFKRTPKELGLSVDMFVDEEGSRLEAVTIQKSAGESYGFRKLRISCKVCDTRVREEYQSPSSQLRVGQGDELHEFLQSAKLKMRPARVRRGAKGFTMEQLHAIASEPEEPAPTQKGPEGEPTVVQNDEDSGGEEVDLLGNTAPLILEGKRGQKKQRRNSTTSMSAVPSIIGEADAKTVASGATVAEIGKEPAAGVACYET